MKLLVTGGAGFIGSAVVRLAVSRGHSVVVLDALTYAGNLRNLEPVANCSGFFFERIDICDPDGLERVFRTHDPDAVLHLAAETHVDRSIDGPLAFVVVNMMGTARLLEAARAHWGELPEPRRTRFRLLQVSTDEVYGSLGPRGRFTEGSPYDPRSPYAASKAAADHLVRAWGITYGLPILLTNCSNNYGPFHYPEKLIPKTILSGLAGRPIELFGSGLNVRDWLHVEDHAVALLTVLDRGRVGETYVVGGDAEAANIDVARMICAELDAARPRHSPHERLITFVADRPGHDIRYAIDARKIREELGWSPSVTLAEGLRRTVAWYLDNEDWWRPMMDRDGVASRLGKRRTGDIR